MTHKTDSLHRIMYPVARVDEGKRIRTDYGDLEALAQSIRDHGLIHPIVINSSGVLIAGGRRFRAMRDLLKWTEVPVTYFEFADEATLRILEREENVRRKQMTWQEEAISISEVHSFHKINASLKSERWTQEATGELLGQSEASVSYALKMAKLIKQGDREILACARISDAISLVVKRQTELSNSILAKQTIPRADPASAKALLDAVTDDADDFFVSPVGPTAGGVGSLTDDGEMPSAQSDAPPTVIPLSKMLLHGDSLDILNHMPAESVDHIITDWPYGIDFVTITDQMEGRFKNNDLIEAEHNQQSNEALHANIIPHLFRVLRPGGFFITFTDYMQWQRNYDLCTAAGFTVQKWPLIWFKTGRCINQAALFNFTKNHEPAIVCRKSASLLSAQSSSIWSGDAAGEVAQLGHPFAKPFGLWRWIYSAVCLKGHSVLDPFAGRGSSTIAAIQHGLSPIAIEVNPAHYAALVVNVSSHYQSQIKNVTFA